MLLARYGRALRYERLPFEWRVRLDALAPGVFNQEVLGQSKWWIDLFGAAYRIRSEQFQTAHLLHVVMFLREYAALRGEDGRAIRDSPLMQELVAELARRTGDPNPLIRHSE
ncbi:hypothetical protein [Agromyces sp. NPDC058104]|uniref:hypothetical protein n=1 Tax=Agromyces sp. NPDC058104 TaxID=3346342 RepID=UPI0036D86B6F